VKLDELRHILREADSAAVLVPAHVLERLIQQIAGLPSFPWRVPHRECLLIERQELFRHAEQDELDLEPGRLLPPKVILLARPPTERLAATDDGPLLLECWRRLFHCAVHRELSTKWSRQPLTDSEVQERVARLGRAAFAEVRSVLDRDRCLLTPGDERSVFAEFAAVYLELRHFSPALVSVYFPGLPPRAEVDALLAEDIADSADLFARTRPPGAPDPSPPDEGQSDEAHDYFRRLTRAAAAAAARGNDVRAAILHTKAARVAPAALASGAREEATRDLNRLVERLRAALELDDTHVAGWMQDLPPLLDRADQGPRPVEAALLFDLQKACTEHEREAYALDIVEWLVSAGRRPVQRPLPGLRLVRITRLVRDAARRLTTARLADAERRHLAGLLQEALRGCEERVRQRVGPALADAFLDAGLQPTSTPERVAFAKMVEELLDRTTDQGYFTFGDLRDVISRNGLKVADLGGPEEFLRGDPLLRLDRRLAALLDGIYRRGDVYLRWLHRATALFFGTPAGRAVTRYVAVPFGGALVLTEGLDFILKKTTPDSLTELLQSPFRYSDEAGTVLYTRLALSPRLTPERFFPNGVSISAGELLHGLLWLSTGALLLALVVSGGLRQFCLRSLNAFRRASRWLVFDLPGRVLRNARLRAVVMSWPVQLGYAYVLKPLVFWCVMAYFWPILGSSWLLLVMGLVATSVVINSRTGQAIEQAFSQVPASIYGALTAGLIPGLIRWVLGLFKSFLGLAEYAAHAVDEWLRFRSGDNLIGRAVRAVLGLLWFPIGWLVRFYLVVLIEPGFNPVKAPLAIIAAKFMYPILLIDETIRERIAGFFGGGYIALAGTYATLWLLPDAVAFLIWETKENWGLYRANRALALRPVPVGRHGETVKGLLRPGFHSGTVPRLYDRLRWAEGRAAAEGDWRAVRANRQELHETAAAVRKFFERELLALLELCEGWRGRLSVGSVTLSTNAIRVEVRHGGHLETPLVVSYTQRGNWLMAGLSGPGWLATLSPTERTEFANALAGFYKLSAVDLVREQLLLGLPTGFTTFELEGDRIALHTKDVKTPWVWYDLTRWSTRLRPENADGSRTVGPELLSDRFIFRRVELTLAEWEDAWRPTTRPGGVPRLMPAAAALALTEAQEVGWPAPSRIDIQLPEPAVAQRNGAK
jgi:hypothetical protein